MSPVEAVTYASYLAPKGALAGDFEMEVKGVGEDRGQLFLNSEIDYRDRNCLTIAMPLAVARRLTGKTDMADIKAAFAGKRISVRGVARRVRIDFTEGGKPTGKYYYQVHVPIGRPDQLMFEGAGRFRG
jgi:hypothetical protein